MVLPDVVPDVVPLVVVPLVVVPVVVLPLVLPEVVPLVLLPLVLPDVLPLVVPSVVLPLVEPEVPVFSEAVQALKRLSDAQSRPPVRIENDLLFIGIRKSERMSTACERPLGYTGASGAIYSDFYPDKYLFVNHF
ncbi:MAG: hypothetical protein JWP58_1868 [Hymenobacter sp.]|nr:hypothetical protein [Hymenobacter sp.]